MNNIKAIVFTFIIVVIICSCTSLAPTVPMATLDQDAKAKQFQVIPDKALLYIIRTKGSAWGITNSIVVDKLVVGTLKDGSYAVAELSPGKHIVSVLGNFEGDCVLKIDTEKGKIYFVKTDIGMGWARPRMYIELVGEQEGKTMVNEYNLIDCL